MPNKARIKKFQAINLFGYYRNAYCASEMPGYGCTHLVALGESLGKFPQPRERETGRERKRERERWHWVMPCKPTVSVYSLK